MTGRAINVTTCRCCPFRGGGATSQCNLRTWAPMGDSDNQRSVHCPLDDGPVTVTGSDPEWLKKIKEGR